MKPAAGCVRWLLALAIVVVEGCASPPRPAAPVAGSSGPWSGRLALQVEDNPGQSFSAGFELKGSPRAGELSLYTPLGGTLALLDWAPGSATLHANGKSQEFGSIDALVTHATGAAIPVAALFDWLRGIDTPVAGWKPDLTLLAQGRLRAQRLEPPPPADLRLVLDQ